MTDRLSTVASVVSMEWLTGPIFNKELRVASRRRRTYALRFGYLALLTIVVAIVWISTMEHINAGDPMIIYRMSEAGKAVTATVAWFQFIAIQLIAVVVTSTSISEEVYRGTINSLMTTPITSLQIVMGKMLSKLWQMIILVAISMPMLAIVQVFGGVPWEYVISSSCITLTAGLMAASGTMFYSVLFRRAWVTILLTFATGFFLYSVLPLIIGLVMALISITTGSGEMFVKCLMYSNPFSAMMFVTIEMSSPGGNFFTSGLSFAWIFHCLFMLLCSAGILALCVLLVRRRALRNTMSGVSLRTPPQPLSPIPPIQQASYAQSSLTAAPPMPGVTPPPPIQPYVPAPAAPPQAAGKGNDRIRAVTGSPVLWKELRTPLIRSPIVRVLALGGIGGLLAVLYLLIGGLGELQDRGIQAAFVGVLTAIGTLCTAVIAATSISAERESRSFPILLTTPLSDWHILLAKAAGIARRCAPVWALLAGHLIVFTTGGLLNPVILLCMSMIVLGTSVFLIGTGIYFGSAVKKTTLAVVMNLGLAIVLWLVIPVFLEMAHIPLKGCWFVMMLVLVGMYTFIRPDALKILLAVSIVVLLILMLVVFSVGIPGIDHDFAENMMLANPVYESGSLTSDLTNFTYPSVDIYDRMLLYTHSQIAFYLFVAYTLAGAVFFMLAKRDFRKNIF